MSKLRLVLDTNILISALLSKRSTPFYVVSYAFKHHILLVSQETLGEFEKVVFRKKFDKYLSNEERYIFIAKFMVAAEMIEIIERFDVCRDTKDNCFLDLAVNGQADFLITGDEDLLVLNPFQNTEIISADSFTKRFIGV
ncbi:MAG: putative toxin-antitoxin system toxin component, PIN family [Cyanobacteria bacterium]|nr:putative toxin-antitoxin system toxin component, PIN family [Cyanobacteriota bacterium]